MSAPLTLAVCGNIPQHKLNITVDATASRVDIARLKCMLKCVFSLSEEEAQVLTYLILRGRGAIAKDIAEALGRNPEVVRRALRSLYMHSLVVRRPYPLRRGGRAYLYEVPEHIVEAVAKLCREVQELDELVKSRGNGKG
ncbi:transcriptional regulator [Hyperthermus butylicus]|uniref:Transcriptional regulator n=1 Tax=Hyperthermus butylicus (strain DSM 5456 / JCM 9403 / PLM1-5) TaxID=415426 RepID=A2BIX3_HYPBU|nr:transcriptional regulator [Hyperthermus butylicus]ABM79934.1 putative transcriptional regulator [Hyperthermus butylicus DSM 5456]